MGEALVAAGDFFSGRVEQSRRRQAVIVANPSLQERELTKLASLAAAVAGALRGRGVGDPAAILIAEAGISVFKIAFESWVADCDDRDFATVLAETLAVLKAGFRPPME